ncbi:MAG: phage tail tape measure protein [Gemmatimonadaceae bacterium]|nr:phage tail tape measure protein [Gemmatimonadaceae bacterium]
MRSTELLARMRLDTSQFDRAVRGSNSELQQFARVANALPGRSSVFGRMAADAANLSPALSSVPLGIAAVGAALTGAGLAARRAGVDFEAALAKISTLGPDAQRNLSTTRQAILDTFSAVPVTGSVQDLAEANYLLQSSGRTASEAITDLRTAAEASVAGYTSVTTAVDGLTTVTNAWKESQISTRQASDVLFTAVNLGKATFEQIAHSIGLVAPLAASAGVSLQEVAAATAVLSNGGMVTSSIFEGLRSAILNIQRPTEDFKKKYGALAAEFDASKLARDGLVKFLQDFQERSGGSQKALNALFTDATGVLAVLGLMKNKGDDAAAALKRMGESTGETNDALSKVNGSSEAQERLIRNQLTGAWTDFGDLLRRTTIPLLEGVARALNRAKGGAAFLKSDIDILQSTLGPKQLSTMEERQRRGAAASILTQFGANRDNPEFFRSITDDELRFLRQQMRLIHDTAQPGERFPGSFEAFDTALVLERNRRAEQAALANAGGEEKPGKGDGKGSGTGGSSTELRTAAAEAKRRAEEYRRESERLVSEASELTQKLQTAAIEATQGSAAALQSAMERTLNEGASRLSDGVLGPKASAALEKQLTQFELLQKEMIAAERQSGLTRAALDAAASKERTALVGADKLSGETDPAKAVQTSRSILDARARELRVLIDTTQTLALRKQYEEQLNEIITARSPKDFDAAPLGENGSRELMSQVGLMGDLAQQIATVGDKLGLLPRAAVDALRGIGALAEQGSKLQDALKVGSSTGTLGKIGIGIGVAGGIASLAQSLFSESPADKQRRADLQANTSALRQLTSRVGDLAGSTLAGSTTEKIRSTLSGSFFTELANTPWLATIENLPALIASRAGVSVAEVMSLAGTLGIDLSDTNESMRGFRDLVMKADLNGYIDSYAGSLQRLDDTLRADGVTDGAEIFRRRVAVLTDPKTGFPALTSAITGLDLDTVEGRNEARTRARALYDDVVNGRVSLGQFGGLSIQEGSQALIDFITSVMELNDGDAAGTGGFNVTRSITEVTGSRLAGLLGSANTYLAGIATDIAALRATFVTPAPFSLQAPSAGAIAGLLAGGGLSIGSVSVVVNLTLTADLLGVDAGRAATAGTALGHALGKELMSKIDIALRDRQLRQRLVTGNATLSR